MIGKPSGKLLKNVVKKLGSGLSAIDQRRRKALGREISRRWKKPATNIKPCALTPTCVQMSVC